VLGKRRETCDQESPNSFRPSIYNSLDSLHLHLILSLLRREKNVTTNATLAGFCRKSLSVKSIVHAGSAEVTSKVGPRVAAVAVLPLHGRIDFSIHGITDEHSKTLNLS
jgi:hypothetical protein